MVSNMQEEIDFEEEYELISKDLQTFGLTEYQARTYTALVAHGVAEADTIANTAGIPRTSVYKALDGLHEMGYVVVSQGRPRIYRPAEPLELKSRITNKLDKVFGRLNTLSEALAEKGEPQVIYTIHGKNRVMDKVGEVLRKTTHEIIISCPHFSQLLDSLEPDFVSAKKRGVEMTIITESGQKVLDWAKVERREGLIATDLISDGTRALLASPDFEACGYTNNPALASHLVNFMDILMQRS